MRRRAVLGAIGLLATAALPPFARAQRMSRRPARIGFGASFFNDIARRTSVAAMVKRGWREGQDFVFLESGIPSGDWGRVKEAITKGLAADPDVLVVDSTAHAIEAHRQTKTVPIVMLFSGYPVEAGLADSLARPGKNVTGNALYVGTGIWGKLLQLLKETRPGLERIGVLWTYVPPAFAFEEIEPAYQNLRRDAKGLSVTLTLVEAASQEHLSTALAKLDAARPQAMLTTSGAIGWKDWVQIMAFANDRRLPTIIDLAPIPDDRRPTPLMHYAPPFDELWGRVYDYVDRILKGAEPRDLPIQQPARFELVVNLKTAKAIGLTIPQPLLLRADRVIE